MRRQHHRHRQIILNNNFCNVILIALLIANTLVSGCAQAPVDSDEESDLVMSDEARRNNLLACQNSSLYTCISEHYANNLTNMAEEGDFACVTFSDGATICPSGTAYSYNYAAYEQTCSATKCNKSNNYFAYKCRANIPGPGGEESTPHRDLDRALRQAYDNCVEATMNDKR